MKATPQITFVNLATLPWVDVVAQKLHKNLHALIARAAREISQWYEEHHYHEELHKATEDEIAAAKQGVDETLNQLDWSGLFAPLAEYMSKMYTAGADVPTVGGFRPLDLNFLKPDPTAVKYSQMRSAELVGKKVLEDGSVVDNPNPEWAITPQLREDIRATVQKALEGEPSPGDLAKDIQHLAGFQYPRARMISRTELAFAYNSGHHDQAHRMGYTMKSSILGSMHKEPDECDDNASQGWIPIEELFQSGDEMPPYHPNCVCDLLYKRKEEEDDWSTATSQTSREVTEELKATGEPFTPSTPESIQVPPPVSSYLPLKEVADAAKPLSQDAYQTASSQAHAASQSWDAAQRSAVLEYTDQGAAEWNRELRRGDVGESTRTHIQHVEQSISHDLPHNTEVYRGVGTSVGKRSLEVFREYSENPDKLVNDPLLLGDRAFSSFSASRSVATSFLSRITASDSQFSLFIKAALPKGSPTLPLGALSRFPEEKELLLRPGAVFRVVEVRATPEVYVMKTKGVRTTITAYLNDNPLEEFNHSKLKKISQGEARRLLRSQEAIARPYPGMPPKEAADAKAFEGGLVTYGRRRIEVRGVYLKDAKIDEIQGDKETVLSDITKSVGLYQGEPRKGSMYRRWQDDEVLLVRRA